MTETTRSCDVRGAIEQVRHRTDPIGAFPQSRTIAAKALDVPVGLVDEHSDELKALQRKVSRTRGRREVLMSLAGIGVYAGGMFVLGGLDSLPSTFRMGAAILLGLAALGVLLIGQEGVELPGMKAADPGGVLASARTAQEFAGIAAAALVDGCDGDAVMEAALACDGSASSFKQVCAVMSAQPR